MSASAQKITFDMESDAMDIRQSSGSPDRYRVLLVDEQAHVLRVLRMNLDRQGYDIDTATNSEEALTQLRQGKTDVMIITSDLPDMNARRLCEKAEVYQSANSILVLVGAPNIGGWIESSAVAEPMQSPLSLRWVVSRMNDFFGVAG